MPLQLTKCAARSASSGCASKTQPGSTATSSSSTAPCGGPSSPATCLQAGSGPRPTPPASPARSRCCPSPAMLTCPVCSHQGSGRCDKAGGVVWGGAAVLYLQRSRLCKGCGCGLGGTKSPNRRILRTSASWVSQSCPSAQAALLQSCQSHCGPLSSPSVLLQMSGWSKQLFPRLGRHGKPQQQQPHLRPLLLIHRCASVVAAIYQTGWHMPDTCSSGAAGCELVHRVPAGAGCRGVWRKSRVLGFWHRLRGAAGVHQVYLLWLPGQFCSSVHCHGPGMAVQDVQTELGYAPLPDAVAAATCARVSSERSHLVAISCSPPVP